MNIPVAIDFSRVYAEKVLYSETIQYKILKDMNESEWKGYKTRMLAENIQVSYDTTTDTFNVMPLKEKRTLTESRNSGNLNLAKTRVVKDNTLFKEGECWDGYKIGDPKTKVSDKTGKRVNNCEPINEDESLNEVGFTQDGEPMGFHQNEEACYECDGQGETFDGKKCIECNGTGIANEYSNDDENNIFESDIKRDSVADGSTEYPQPDDDEACAYCDGTGFAPDLGGVPCSECGGTGYATDDYESHLMNESAQTKKNLLMDGDEEDDDDFDSSMSKLLNFTDEDDETPIEEPIEDEDEIGGIDTASLEDLINGILDARDNSAKSKFKEIPAGEINNDLGDFGSEATVQHSEEEPQLLGSEFPENQDRIELIQDRLDSEITYQDYLNGDTDKSEGSAIMVDIDDEPAEDMLDTFTARSDDFEDEAGEMEIDDDDFDRNRTLTGDDDGYEEEILNDANDYNLPENPAIQKISMPKTNSIILPGQSGSITITLSGMNLSEGEIKSITAIAEKKNMKVTKISNLNENDSNNTYIAFFNNKETEVKANTSYEAQQKAIAHFKPAKSKQHMVHVKIAQKNGKDVIHSTMEESLNIFVECNNKHYKINYTDVSKGRGKMPFSIKHEKFQSLQEACERISSINKKSLKEKANFKKFVTKDILDNEVKSAKGSDIFEGYENVRDTKAWNVKALGNVSLKTGINEVLSNITTNKKDRNTLVKTNEGQFFLIKGSLNERSQAGVIKQLVDMDRKCEYGTAKVIGVYENSLRGLGQIMESIQRTNIPLLIWK